MLIVPLIKGQSRKSRLSSLVTLSETRSDQNIELEVPSQVCTARGFMYEQEVYLHEKLCMKMTEVS